MLLRFIDEGRIDDPAGPVRDGTDCIIVMTSNVRTESLQDLVQTGDYRRNKWEIRKHLREALLQLEVPRGSDSSGREPFRFRVEFLNRVDEVILFRALTEVDMMDITLRHLQSLSEPITGGDANRYHLLPKSERRSLAYRSLLRFALGRGTGYLAHGPGQSARSGD